MGEHRGLRGAGRKARAQASGAQAGQRPPIGSTRFQEGTEAGRRPGPGSGTLERAPQHPVAGSGEAASLWELSSDRRASGGAGVHPFGRTASAWERMTLSQWPAA